MLARKQAPNPILSPLNDHIDPEQQAMQVAISNR